MKRSLFTLSAAALLTFAVAAHAENTGSSVSDRDMSRSQNRGTSGEVKSSDTGNLSGAAQDPSARGSFRGDTSTLDQSNNQQHLQTTAQIRRALMDSDMSSYAKNVKVITDDSGRVTLRGPVRTEQEKNRVEQLAKQHATGKIDNQLVVEPQSGSRTSTEQKRTQQ